ncbi:MAG TPA: choice-of-anchor tandem repeat GloVer-containing protein [Terriglobales bacterium]|nr:choice-of-anchor tandem repeat GloVer-containing protein [Terriglobales bacterium]
MHILDWHLKSSRAAIALTILVTLVLFAGTAISAPAQTETLIYQFKATPDGANPKAGLVLKGKTLYGTTWEGGAYGSGDTGWGTVFSVTTSGKETVLYNFAGPWNDAGQPMGGVALDKAGNIYGTSLNGGVGYNAGTVWMVTKKGQESILHTFVGLNDDGMYPYYVTPVLDKAGNLYGTTVYGGHYGNGVVFKLTPTGGYSTLHSFSSTNDDGYNPVSGVTLDAKGNIYGVAAAGGTYGFGVLFEITAAGSYSVLYNFQGGGDGMMPYNPPVLKGGSLYGTTEAGGANNCGAVYKFTPAKGKKPAKETILHSFTNQPEGVEPWTGALVFDKQGNIYGTTMGGGTYASGMVYKLAPNGTLTVLYSFDQTPNGGSPFGGVVLDTAGNLYTTAAFGGNLQGEYGAGTIVKITP